MSFMSARVYEHTLKSNCSELHLLGPFKCEQGFKQGILFSICACYENTFVIKFKINLSKSELCWDFKENIQI